MKGVCFPKSYTPLANWPWLRISPQSFVCYLLFDPYCLTMTVMNFTCIPVQIEPNKSPLGKGSWPFSFERSASFPPQADHILVDLFSSMAANGALQAGRAPPQLMVRLHTWTNVGFSYSICKIGSSLRSLECWYSKILKSPDQVAWLVRVSSQYPKVLDLISHQGTYRKQQMNG